MCAAVALARSTLHSSPAEPCGAMTSWVSVDPSDLPINTRIVEPLCTHQMCPAVSGAAGAHYRLRAAVPMLLTVGLTAREEAGDPRRLRLRYPAMCADCAIALSKGADAYWSRDEWKATCLACAPPAGETGPGTAGASAAAEVVRRKRTAPRMSAARTATSPRRSPRKWPRVTSRSAGKGQRG